MISDKIFHMSFTDKGLQVEQELETFLVWYLRERIVWHILPDYWVQRGITVFQTVFYHVLVHRYVPKVSIHKREIFTVNFSTDFPLFKNGEAFIEPHVAPVLTSDLVASPRMGNLMGGHINLRLVTSDNCWRRKGKQWVFHTSHWKRWW